MDTKALIFIIVLCLMAGFLGLQTYHLVSVMSKPLTLNINGQSVSSPESSYYGELSDLLILGKRFADNHEYSNDITECTEKGCVFIEDNYDCENYSSDFASIATALGFEVSIESACKYANLTECHSYNTVIIPYEPQTGDFKDISKEYPYKR